MLRLNTVISSVNAETAADRSTSSDELCLDRRNYADREHQCDRAWGCPASGISAHHDQQELPPQAASAQIPTSSY
ncbi:hypothetical protein ON010_g12235 [Phytophthora cinnamomi]|nr:hypothetical protein ON010_g12235 [Phytophthora cinnamomi]